MGLWTWCHQDMARMKGAIAKKKDLFVMENQSSDELLDHAIELEEIEREADSLGTYLFKYVFRFSTPGFREAQDIASEARCLGRCYIERA